MGASSVCGKGKKRDAAAMEGVDVRGGNKKVRENSVI